MLQRQQPRIFLFAIHTLDFTSASEDSTVKLWSLPDGGLTQGSMRAEDAVADLTFNYTAVRRVDISQYTSF